MKTYHTQIEVRGYELDSFGHVNHANYLNYFEFARWKMLAEEGITLALLESLKRWPVIAQIEIQYLKPTFMGEILDIQTRCIDHGKASFIFEQIILREGKPVTQARIQGVMVNELGRPAHYPEIFQKIWQ